MGAVRDPVPAEEYADLQADVRNELSYIRERVDGITGQVEDLTRRVDLLMDIAKSLMASRKEQGETIGNLLGMVERLIGLVESRLNPSPPPVVETRPPRADCRGRVVG